MKFFVGLGKCENTHTNIQKRFIENIYIYIWTVNIYRKWLKMETLFQITDPVHDVRFAPNLGRSYFLLAIAARELSIVSMKVQRYDMIVEGFSEPLIDIIIFIISCSGFSPFVPTSLTIFMSNT